MNKSKSHLRDLHGIILLDKPLHMSSTQALQAVKHLLHAKKAGHTGSLDPLASGMLPLCFGEATKFSQFLLEADKVYDVHAQLGIKTTTGDAEGDVIQKRDPSAIGHAQLVTVLKKFQGEISQVPSMYSAIKHKGQPLYKLARQGIVVERPSRLVTIYQLDLLAYELPNFHIIVCCSKGTYIRTLIEDIGDALGCGAYVTQLRRLSVAGYAEQQMVTLTQLQEASSEEMLSHLLPIETMVNHWPIVRLSQAAAYYVKRGEAVIIPAAPSSGWVQLILQNGDFLGVGEILKDGRVAPRRLVQQKNASSINSK